MIECAVADATGGGWADHHDAACRFGRPARNRSAAVEPGEAAEDEVECELELGVVVAPAEDAAVRDREGHLHDVGMAGAECAGEVRVVIDSTYPLDQAAGAVTHMLEHHPSGKIAITA
jgi:hypothetical protein